MPVLAAIDVEQAPNRPITVGYDLATAYDDTLIVLYVMSEEEYSEQQTSREDLPKEVRQEGFTIDRAIDTAAQEAADAVNGALDAPDRQRIQTRGRVGSPADKILAATRELDPRYVVVGGRRRSSTRQALFGSVSQTVLRNADQPVVALMEPAD